MQNVHNIHNENIDNIGIRKHEKHLRRLSSGTKLFITFEFKGFSTEGERYHLSMLTFPSAPNHVPTRHKASASKRKSTSLFRRQKSTNWLFSNLIPRFRCVTSLTSLVINLSGIFIVTSLNATSAPRAREHLRSCLYLTNPCTEPKGSQPN